MRFDRTKIERNNTVGWPGYLDEFRIATTWPEVAGVPEPALLSLVLAGALGLRKK